MCMFSVLLAAFTMHSQTWGNVQIQCLSLFSDLIAEEVARSRKRREMKKFISRTEFTVLRDSCKRNI